MDVGFAAVEPVPGKVHAERTFGVDQCIRARRAAPAELAQQRGLPAHTRPPRLQCRVQEIPQAWVDVGFVAVEHVPGKVHAERTFGSISVYTPVTLTVPRTGDSSGADGRRVHNC